MNKKTLQKKASLLLEQYLEMLSEQRCYERENWHCVNVKRYHDSTEELDEIIKKAPLKYQKQLKEKFDDDYTSNIYERWLCDLWDQLNYELGDIAEITKGSKDERGAFEFIEIEHWGNDKIAMCLGRSGGWACFQDTMDYVEESLTAIIDWDIVDMSLYEIDVECKEEPLDDVIVKLNNIDTMMDEVVFIKNYIEKFNTGANFTDEVKFRIDEEVESLKIENKSIAEDKSRLIQDLTAGINTMQARLDAFKENEADKLGIQRHLTGLVKILRWMASKN